MEEAKHVISTRPIFDVFSISIHPCEPIHCLNPLSDGELCRVYGMVKVCDEHENVYYLYNRKQDNPDIVSLKSDITLTGFPVICCKAVTVSVYLYDMAHEAEISNGSFTLDYTTRECRYDEPQNSKVKGEYGFADVCYATFLHAVVADVEKVSLSGGSGDLFGRVVARLDKADGQEYASVILCDNQRAEFDTAVQLYRTSVAVPAFCTLKIKVEFGHINEDIVQHQHGQGLFGTSARSGNCDITVKVRWPYCYENFRSGRELNDQVDAKQVFKNNLKSIKIRSQHLSQGVDGITRIRSKYTRPTRGMYFSFVQVFSVSVFSYDNSNNTDVHGTVKLVNSSCESLSIFDGRDKLSKKHTSLMLQCPPSMLEVSNNRFQMVVNLKNEDDRIVGKGTREWSDMNTDGFFDRHLCSVFKGDDNAYTTVHYSIFERSIQAGIAVSIVRKDKIPETELVDVCGSVTVEYGSYEYSTPYDEQHYKCRIFSRSEDECCKFELGSGSNLELAKSVVAVPLKDTLVFNVNLELGFQGLKQVVEFKPYKGNMYAVERGDYTLVILVEWRDASDSTPFTFPHFSDMRSLRKLMPKIR